VRELEEKCKLREVEFESYRCQLQNKPESRLQEEIGMLSLEKVSVHEYMCPHFLVSFPGLPGLFSGLFFDNNTRKESSEEWRRLGMLHHENDITLL